MAAHLLALLLSCPVEAIQRQEPGEADGGPGKGENGCLSLASGCAGVPGMCGEWGELVREGGREGRREGLAVLRGERRGLGRPQECRHVLAGGAGRKAAARGREPGRAVGASSAAVRLLVAGGPSPVALAAAELLSKCSLVLAGCSQARASAGPIKQRRGTLPLPR